MKKQMKSFRLYLPPPESPEERLRRGKKIVRWNGTLFVIFGIVEFLIGFRKLAVEPQESAWLHLCLMGVAGLIAGILFLKWGRKPPQV